MKRSKQTSVVTWITTLAVLVLMCASLTFSQRTTAQSSQETKTASQRNTSVQDNSDYPVLSKYATDLTQLTLEGRLDPPSGYTSEINCVIASLARTTTKAPVVVGESGLDRDAIARGVALTLLSSDVPEILRNRRVLSLSVDALAKGARTSPAIQDRAII